MKAIFGAKKNDAMWRGYYRSVLSTIPVIKENILASGLSLHSVVDAWVYRYGTRRGVINGMLIGDRDVVVARNRQRFAISPFIPQMQFVRILPDPAPPYRFPHPDLYYETIKLVRANHPEYGPLLQWFVREAETNGRNETQLCESIRDWGLKSPPQIAEFERRSDLLIRGTAVDALPAALLPYVHTEVTWHCTEDLDRPWIASIGDQTWSLRLNDFPEEILYTLIVNGQSIGDLNDVPKKWRRSKRRHSRTTDV
jgi:hypothetical protein